MRSKRDLKRFLLASGSHLSADDFDFSVNGKCVKAEGKSTHPAKKICYVMLLLKTALLGGIHLLHYALINMSVKTSGPSFSAL